MIHVKQQKIILDYLQPFQPNRIGIFGSYARNEQNETSDLDILVNFNKKINLLDFIGIELDLTELLGIKVDLVSEQSLLPSLRPYIEKDLQSLL